MHAQPDRSDRRAAAAGRRAGGGRTSALDNVAPAPPGMAAAARAWIQAASLLLACAATPLHASAQAPSVPRPLPADSTPAPVGAAVFIAGDTLLRVRTPLGGFTAAQRAAAVNARLQALIADPFALDSRVEAREVDGRSDVVLGDMVLLTVTEADARAAGVPRAELALSHAATLEQALRRHTRGPGLRPLLLAALQTLLATAALVLLLRLLRDGFNGARARIAGWEGTRIAALRVQRLELVSAAQFVGALRTLLTLLRVAATIALLYGYLVVVFSFFPGTRGWAARLRDYVAEPVATVLRESVAFVPNLFFIVVIIVFTSYVLKVIRLIFTAIEHGTIEFEGFYRDWALPSYKIVRFLVIAFSVIMIWPLLPASDTTAFRGVAAFLGLLLTFGSAAAVANVVGGAVMVYMRPFQVGDRVKIADTIGDVVEKNLLVTRVRTVKNVDVTIPNSMVLNSHIINYSSSAQSNGLILHTAVTIGYDVEWRKVHELLIAAADATDRVLKEPRPFVLQTALDDFYVHYELNAHTNRPNIMGRTYSDLHQNIQDLFAAAGIEIMSPHYGAHRDGSRAALPDAHLSPEYRPPPFRVEQVDGGQHADGSGGKGRASGR